ncbi:cysteinyl leukotriene receptor 1-like [Saccostrea cucullata]|uniref:cysteinyl leukotriene receptor 1-like n=1 Tax=Saccostrea cuccullata TaxID=36930 RepID=UPI002ED39D1C
MSLNTSFSNRSSTIHISVEFQISLDLWIYFSPVLLVVGAFGNTASIFILTRRSFRKSTCMFYLTMLSVADLMVLYTALLRFWIRSAFSVDIRTLSLWSCKIHAFLVYFAMDFSSWVLMTVTLDRFVLVCFPFKAHLFSTMKKAPYVLLIVVLFLIFVNSHFFATVTIKDTSCTYENEITMKVWPWVDLIVCNLIPFLVMLVCSIMISRKVLQTKKRVAAQNSLSVPEESVIPSNDGRQILKTSSITIMLLTIIFSFFLLTLPLVVFKISLPYWILVVTNSELQMLELVRTIFSMLSYTNHVIHFFCCLSGRRFRREVRRVTCCYRK